MKTVQYVRLASRTNPEDTTEFWIVKRGDHHYVLKLARGFGIEIGVETAGDLPQCKRVFELEAENVMRATQLSSREYEVVTRKLDAQGKKRLTFFDSPMVDINWGHMPGETTASEQFLRLLRKQLKDWKGSSNGLNVTRHREWPDFHAMVVKAVKAKYGSRVVLYRGIHSNLAKKVIDGGPLSVRPYSSWTPELSAARQYKGGGHKPAWAVVKVVFKAESIALAPVHLPDYDDPNILDPLAHDVQHVGDELIVQWRQKAIPRNRVTVVAKTKAK